MHPVTPTVLLVGTDEEFLQRLARAARRQPYRLYMARSAPEAMSMLAAGDVDVDVVVADERMPDLSGGELLDWSAVQSPETERILLIQESAAPAALRKVADGMLYHFFVKPCDPPKLAMAIAEAVEHAALVRENRRLDESQQFADCAIA